MRIEKVVRQTKSVRELRQLNRRRLKQLNQVLANQKSETPWVYPYDFQCYSDNQQADLFGLDDLGGKRKIDHKQVVSMAFGRVELSAVDAMVSFNARTPASWQQKWARNLQIKKSRLTSRVEQEEPDISEK